MIVEQRQTMCTWYVPIAPFRGCLLTHHHREDTSRACMNGRESGRELKDGHGAIQAAGVAETKRHELSETCSNDGYVSVDFPLTSSSS